MSRSDDIRSFVSKSYAGALKSAVGKKTGKSGAGTGSSCCSGSKASQQSLADMAGYSRDELAALPPDAVASSFGCGNPVALAAIREGDTVLDLGSGAGIDLLLAARLAGPRGKVIGVDMTPEMVEQARKNATAAGLTNVDVRQGLIENLPVEPESVDLVISNCVINLSPEKDRVFRELFRVLKPGGRISISDIVSEPLPAWATRVTALYAACVAGAIPESAYLAGLREVGLVDLRVADRMVYDAEQMAGLLGSVDGGGCGCGCGGAANRDVSTMMAAALVGKVASVRFTGVKPAGR